MWIITGKENNVNLFMLSGREFLADLLALALLDANGVKQLVGPCLAIFATGYLRQEAIVSLGSGQEVCFGPSRPDPERNTRDEDGTRTGQDGPHLETRMGPKRCKTKHMANLDGTPSDPGWDLDGSGLDPETVTDLWAFLSLRNCFAILWQCLFDFRALGHLPPIRENRFADSRESPDSRESLQDSRTEPLFCESRFRGAKNCESQVWRRSTRIARTL